MTIYQERVQQVRTFMRERLAVQGFIISRADVYQSEYVVDADERLSWLTGFTGSAGFAVILENKAALFVDGRYTLQASQEVDPNLFDVFHYPEVNPKSFLQTNLHQGDKLTYDQWLMAKVDYDRWHKIAQELNIHLCPVSENPVDILWYDRPSRPLNPIQLYPEHLAGQSTQDKLATIQALLQQQNIDTFICNAPESICWLFNIRGSDFPFSPLVDAFAIIHQKGKSELFIDSRKIPTDFIKPLSSFVTFREYGVFSEAIRQLTKKHILLDGHRAPMAVTQLIPESANIHWGNDPCTLLKAIKNPVEISGMSHAHVKDGVAVTKFLAWLKQALINEETIDELGIVTQLEIFRKEQEGYQGPSFSTIAGFGANGAVIHYRPTDKTNK
ncbi:MAG TPA: aminopeptidase P family N-terminal domain-containing protein, partial [Candidatus Nitrosotenuis sp.]|nr:aminopeptidase P family N-terminal domain-containing protein [Candidatus Nitrosotenuis sp.]